ncbi:MAG: PKD domain-containing protein [Crocinitomix sp.]|nr:PKD domain-containing protein [Crocinitomix sp.]
MKRLIYLLLFIAPSAFAQPVCAEYTSTGDASSPYILSSDPDCAICEGTGDTGPWSGFGCTGTIVSTAIAPTLSMTLAYTAVNTDDFATISIDGGGVMTITGDGVGVAGDVIGPYLCGGSYGDVFITVESTLPFTAVTLLNTGCSSGWVIACPSGDANAGDDNATVVCTGIVVLEDLLSVDAEPGGTWTETTGSGFFDVLTTEFDAGTAGVGTYVFEYEVIGCGGIIDIATFTVNVGPGGSAGEDNTAEICNSLGFTLDLNTLLVGADPGGDWAETSGSGAFDPVSGVFDASGLAGGIYTFTYTFPVDLPCFDDVADFTITVNPSPIVTIVSDPSPAVICLGETMTLTASGAGGGGIYTWDHPMTNAVPFTPGLGIDNYIVTATDVNGCIGIGNINIEVEPLPNVAFEADILQGCDPLLVTFTNLTDLPGISCIWDFGDGGSTSDCGTVTHLYTGIGDFDVTLNVQSSAICGASATYSDYITVLKQPEAFFSPITNPIDIEDTRVEFDNASLYADYFEWKFGDGSAYSNEFEPVHVYPTLPNITYEIRLVASNSIGCADTAYATITVDDVITFFIPNVFTPDGDDFNEVFKPVMTSGYDPYDYHMVIYNRWGEILFESFDAAYGWNGTYRDGKLAPDGVYVWHIEFGDTITDEKHEYHGHVTILK